MKKTVTWRWLSHGPDVLYGVGLNPDGSLVNPNNYPEDIVRPLVTEAYEQWMARKARRRAEGAKKAVVTRKRRAEKKLYEIVDRIVAGHVYGPSRICAMCNKDLTDPQSIERGIGSDCWQYVIATIEWRRDKAAAEERERQHLGGR